MFKLIFLLFLFTYQVNCESDLNLITTESPNYSVDQFDNEVSLREQVVKIKSPDNFGSTISRDEIIEVPTEVKKAKPVPIDDVSEIEKEAATTLPEVTTILVPTVERIKREQPRYTVKELIYPNGIMHEVGHLRDHGVNRIAKGLNSRMKNSFLSHVADVSAKRVYIHHNYHHIPNHLAYLPVIGRFLDERNKKPKRT